MLQVRQQLTDKGEDHAESSLAVRRSGFRESHRWENEVREVRSHGEFESVRRLTIFLAEGSGTSQSQQPCPAGELRPAQACTDSFSAESERLPVKE